MGLNAGLLRWPFPPLKPLILGLYTSFHKNRPWSGSLWSQSAHFEIGLNRWLESNISLCTSRRPELFTPHSSMFPRLQITEQRENKMQGNNSSTSCLTTGSLTDSVVVCMFWWLSNITLLLELTFEQIRRLLQWLRWQPNTQTCIWSSEVKK